MLVWADMALLTGVSSMTVADATSVPGNSSGIMSSAERRGPVAQEGISASRLQGPAAGQVHWNLQKQGQ